MIPALFWLYSIYKNKNEAKVCFLPWSDGVCAAGCQAELLTGVEVREVASAQHAAEVLRSKGCAAVIITLGDKGSVLNTAQHAGLHIPVPPVKAIDTTVSTVICSVSLSLSLSVSACVWHRKIWVWNDWLVVMDLWKWSVAQCQQCARQVGSNRIALGGLGCVCMAWSCLVFNQLNAIFIAKIPPAQLLCSVCHLHHSGREAINCRCAKDVLLTSHCSPPIKLLQGNSLKTMSTAVQFLPKCCILVIAKLASVI